MRPRRLRSTISMLGIGLAVLCAAHLAPMAKAASASRFHLEESTIADAQRAIRAKEITAEQLVQLYFKRIDETVSPHEETVRIWAMFYITLVFPGIILSSLILGFRARLACKLFNPADQFRSRVRGK